LIDWLIYLFIYLFVHLATQLHLDGVDDDVPDMVESSDMVLS